MAIKAAFVDVDGTIADTEPRNRRAIELVAMIGGHTIKPEDWNHLAGNGDTVIWEKICEETPALKSVFPNALSFEKACLNAKLLKLDEVRAIPETKELLHFLQENGVNVAAVSNSISGDAGATLVKAGFSLTETFNFCLFRDDLRKKGLRAKPFPDPYNEASRMMDHFMKAAANENNPGLQKSECLVVEDSKTGVRAGLAAGMNVLHLTDESGPLDQAEVAKALAEMPTATYHPTTQRDLLATCKKLMSLG